MGVCFEEMLLPPGCFFRECLKGRFCSRGNDIDLETSKFELMHRVSLEPSPFEVVLDGIGGMLKNSHISVFRRI